MRAPSLRVVAQQMQNCLLSLPNTNLHYFYINYSLKETLKIAYHYRTVEFSKNFREVLVRTE